MIVITAVVVLATAPAVLALALCRAAANGDTQLHDQGCNR